LNPTRFLLNPFPGEANPAGVTIGVSIARRAEALSVRFEVRGDLSKVSVPTAGPAPRRMDRLWEETCLELFLGTEDSDRYWEFNLSPAGNWNVYRFTRYREGMGEEPAFPSLPFDVRIGPDSLELSMEPDVEAILPAEKTLRIGVAAVVKTVDGRAIHLALSHPGPRPDFHQRDGFTLRIPG